MSAESDESLVATVGEACGDPGVQWELLLKRSRGSALTLRRGERSQAESWTEEAVAVRVALEDGRSALASAAGRHSVRSAAESALADARRQPLPPAAHAAFAAGAEAPEPREGFAAPEPPAPEALEPLLDALLDSLRQVDERADRLELGRVRQARVTTRLWSSAGRDVEVVQPLALLEAEAIGREISKHAGSFDALAGPRLGLDDARRLGERLGRAVRRQLDGVPRGPGRGGLLLAPEVVGEVTFRLAPALLGLAAATGAAPSLAAGLRLCEDSVEDEAARSLPVDGIGRALERVELTPDGSWLVPSRERLPLVRPGIADLPQPGWLRLSWTSEDGVGDEELVASLETGLYLERAVTESVDAASLTWRGQVEGWWVEGGVGKRPVARVPLTLALPEVLPRLRAVGREPRPAHASGTIRALPWLLDEAPART